MINRVKFYQTLNSKLTLEINRVKAEMQAMDPAPKPVITEHPIDETLQTGESRLLGGGISIQAPWKSESEE